MPEARADVVRAAHDRWTSHERRGIDPRGEAPSRAGDVRGGDAARARAAEVGATPTPTRPWFIAVADAVPDGPRPLLQAVALWIVLAATTLGAIVSGWIA